jgi:hypothetical protein
VKAKPRFKAGQIVKDAQRNFTPRRIGSYLGDGWYYCVQPHELGGIITHKFQENELRPLNAKEIGPRPRKGKGARARTSGSE